MSNFNKIHADSKKNISKHISSPPISKNPASNRISSASNSNNSASNSKNSNPNRISKKSNSIKL